MNNFKFTRRHYYDSPKAGLIYCESSYELKAALLLDEDENVLFYENQQYFQGASGKRRKFDFLVHYKNGVKKLIEIKPLKRLNDYAIQIEDNKKYANEKGYQFACWTEADLGFVSSDASKAWIDTYLTETTGIDYIAIRKKRSSNRTLKHYYNKIAIDKVKVFCEYCKLEHEPLRKNYDKNIAKNGRYICGKEGGSIAGSKPKLHLRKINPYAEEGKKECNGCKSIKLFAEFDKDKSKQDGLVTRCKECRKKK